MSVNKSSSVVRFAVALLFISAFMTSAVLAVAYCEMASAATQSEPVTLKIKLGDVGLIDSGSAHLRLAVMSIENSTVTFSAKVRGEPELQGSGGAGSKFYDQYRTYEIAVDSVGTDTATFVVRKL